MDPTHLIIAGVALGFLGILKKFLDEQKSKKQKEIEMELAEEQLGKEKKAGEQKTKQLEQSKAKQKAKERELKELKAKIQDNERLLEEKTDEVIRILEKLNKADQADAKVIQQLRRELDKAKRDAHSAQEELKKTQDASKNNPSLEKENARLKEQANRYEQRVKQLEKDLRDKGSTSEEDKIPKTWKECADELGLSGNDFTIIDVTQAHRERMKKVHSNRVYGMDEEICRLAEIKSKHANIARDYFKDYFKNNS